MQSTTVLLFCCGLCSFLGTHAFLRFLPPVSPWFSARSFPEIRKDNNLYNNEVKKLDQMRSPRFTAVGLDEGAVGSSSFATSSTSMIDQRNMILLEKLEAATTENLTFVVYEYINFCDESFDKYLNQMIASLPTEKEKQKLGRVRYEINMARQNKLKVADNLLRDILQAGGNSSDFQLKQMEAKLQMHLRKSEIDMAFMVVLQLNIEDAHNSNATMAVQIMQHMQTLIHEYQDNIVSPPVRLLRMLVREDDQYVRKQILRQKLILGENETALKLVYQIAPSLDV